MATEANAKSEAKARHTAGPWTTEYDGAVCIGGEVLFSAPGPESASRDEKLANARLISAAPALLAACKNALVMLRGAESGMNAPGLLTDLPAYKFIADTVARAEGGAA